jgi:hypothetical protein
MGWTPEKHFDPVTLATTRGRSGIGYHVKHSPTSSISNCVFHLDNIISATEIDTWTADGEENPEMDHFEHDPLTYRAFAATAIRKSSQTTPQDFKDAAYEQSGGFPLQELLKKAHDDTHPGFQCTWRRVIRALGPQPGAAGAKVKAEVRRFVEPILKCF